jgi:hypothetical protein
MPLLAKPKSLESLVSGLSDAGPHPVGRARSSLDYFRTNMPVPTGHLVVFYPRSTHAGCRPSLFRFRSWSDGAYRRFRRRRGEITGGESIGFRERRLFIDCRRGIGWRCCRHWYEPRSNTRPHREQHAHGKQTNEGEPKGSGHRNAKKRAKEQPHLRHQKAAGNIASGLPGSKSAWG